MKVSRNSDLDSCTFIKVTLMILVVLYHSSVFWTKSWLDVISVQKDSIFLNIFSRWLNSFHVYGFTLVSGYIFKYMIKSGKYSNFRIFLNNKLKRLILPYLFVSIIWVAPISSIIFSLDKKELLYKYVLCINPSQLWFLWMLFFVFIIARRLKNIINNDMYATLICIVSYSVGIVAGKILPNIFCIWTSFRFLTFFIIGMKVNEKFDMKLKNISIYFYMILHSALFIVVTLISSKTGIIYNILNLGLTYLMNITGSLMAFYVLRDISSKIDWQNNKLFNILSNKTMIIYLFHQQVIYFTIILLNAKIPPLLHMLVNFITAIIISYIISVLLLKNKTTRMLVGEK